MKRWSSFRKMPFLPYAHVCFIRNHTSISPLESISLTTELQLLLNTMKCLNRWIWCKLTWSVIPFTFFFVAVGSIILHFCWHFLFAVVYNIKYIWIRLACTFIPLILTYVRSVDQIPIVDDEMKKAAGDEKEEDIQMTQGIIQKLVTADGTYASQSAFSAMLPVKKDQVRSVIFIL